MSEELVRNLIATSDMIVNGYAFNRLGENVRAVNLNTGGAVFEGHDSPPVSKNRCALARRFCYNTRVL